MTTLHTISKSPASDLWVRVEDLLQGGDAVLFIEDGVYHCINNDINLSEKSGVKIYALAEDVIARGLKNRVLAHVNLADTAGFVDLCVRFDKVLNWF